MKAKESWILPGPAPSRYLTIDRTTLPPSPAVRSVAHCCIIARRFSIDLPSAALGFVSNLVSQRHLRNF
jgi:hypothetical protein